MNRINFAVMALLCLSRIEADEGMPPPLPIEQTGENDMNKGDDEEKYKNLLAILKGLSETLAQKQTQNGVSTPQNEVVADSSSSNNDDSAAKIACKNEVRYSKNRKTGKRQAKVLSREVTITLTKDFFEKEANKSLNFTPGFDDDAVIKISYEKNGANSNENTSQNTKNLSDSENNYSKRNNQHEVAEAEPLTTKPRVAPITLPDPKGSIKEDVKTDSRDQINTTPSADPKLEPKIEKTGPIAFADEPIRPTYSGNANSMHVVDISQGNYSNNLAQNDSYSAGYTSPQTLKLNACTPQLEEATDNCCAQNTCCPPPVTQLNLGYTFGRGIETSHNYATANLLLFPNWNTRNIVPFVSLSAHRLDNSRWASTYGGGARWQPQDACHIWGFNIFYDNLKKHLGTFHQVGAGLEWLSPRWEARVNAYFPVGTKKRLNTVNFFDGYIGGYTIAVREVEQSSRGFDAEIGWNSYYFCDKARLYLGVGPAWFEDYYSRNDQWAFKARALVQWSRYLTFEARTFKESKSDWHWQGAVFLTIPFECFKDICGCGLTDLFSRPVYRNQMIKSSSNCCYETNY